MAAALVCLVLAPIHAAAETGGKFALGLNLGVDFPAGDPTLGPGGVWHLAFDFSPTQALSLALEIGTAANETDAGRTVVVAGIPRAVSLHAVSTLGVLARHSLRAGKVRPYLAGGADYYTSWDVLPSTANSSGTACRSGLGLLVGAGSAFWLGSRWDLYSEGLYHLAIDPDDDARYFAVQGGLRFYLGHKRAS